jgi:ABC-type Fe3+ transport system permease subunit
MQTETICVLSGVLHFERQTMPICVWFFTVLLLLAVTIWLTVRKALRGVTASRNRVILSASVLWLAHCLLLFYTIVNIRAFRFGSDMDGASWDQEQWDLFVTALFFSLASTLICVVWTLILTLEYLADALRLLKAGSSTAEVK